MFALRGIAVSVSMFVVVYAALSLAVSCTWQRLWICSQRRAVRPAAGLLFTWRMLPLWAACVITAAFTVPSFVLLEPRAIDEPVGGVPLLLGLVGAGLAIFGLLNAARALIRASRAIAVWTAGAVPMNDALSVPVLRVSIAAPPMAATGIVHPQVLLSSQAEFVLTRNELQTALNHELVHVRRRDNLKKLLLRLVPFPAMADLESAWVEATEMEADDGAVWNARQALDLAAALVKVSRLAPLESPVELTAALVRSPAAAMNARVERLISWRDRRRDSYRGTSFWCGWAAAATVLAILATTYGQWLVRMHQATEWLIR